MKRSVVSLTLEKIDRMIELREKQIELMKELRAAISADPVKSEKRLKKRPVDLGAAADQGIRNDS